MVMTVLAKLSNTPTARLQRNRALQTLLKQHAERVSHDLQKLGADEYDMLLPEVHALPLLINVTERVTGIVFGRYHLTTGEIGRGALVVTNERVLLLDKKPLFTRCDEINFAIISAVTYSKVGPAGTVTLHTRMGDIAVRTFNKKCALHFITAVENKLFSVQHAQQDEAW
jgi:hypothetical protein